MEQKSTPDSLTQVISIFLSCYDRVKLRLNTVAKAYNNKGFSLEINNAENKDGYRMQRCNN